MKISLSRHKHLKTWLAEPLPKDVAAAIDRLARTDDVRRIAIMPDVHLAGDVCVGTVVAAEHSIFPAAVGGDIGCGMAALAFDAGAGVLDDGASAAKMLAELGRVIPIIRHGVERTASSMPAEVEESNLSDARLETLKRREGRVQFATLGRGNHFLEFQADEDDRLWLMVHSGSRAMGPAIRDFHFAKASKTNVGLEKLDARETAGQSYLADMAWARRYAAASRKAMALAAARAAVQALNIIADESSYFDCDHNHVAVEPHEGKHYFVHRKGASRAGPGERGIIPGSMGTPSFHVQGRGMESALCSSSHGAGRAMTRDAARRTVSIKEVENQMKGVWFDRRIIASLREESPCSYKDIRAVFRAQRDLVKIVRTLRPLLVFKSG